MKWIRVCDMTLSKSQIRSLYILVVIIYMTKCQHIIIKLLEEWYVWIVIIKTYKEEKKERQDNMMLIFMTYLKSLKLSKKAVLTLCQLR